MKEMTVGLFGEQVLENTIQRALLAPNNEIISCKLLYGLARQSMRKHPINGAVKSTKTTTFCGNRIT